jgi:glycerol-3-phosphate acyltransferase PlsY
MNEIAVVLLGYLLGGIPTGYLLVRLVRGVDVRKEGSGNIGAANVVRSSGWGLGIAVLLLDALKGWLASWIAGRMTDQSLIWMSAAALAAMLGHAFPAVLKFRGGKSVATFFGGFLAVSPAAIAAAGVLYLGGLAITRHSSVGSLLAVSTFPLGMWLIAHPGPVVVLIAIAASVLVVWRHRENIRRIRDGTEPKLGAKKRAQHFMYLPHR